MELLDDATQVLSWSAFSTFSACVISQTMRRGGALSLLLLTLDERPGRAGSNDDSLAELTLLMLAGIVNRIVRGGDYVGRYGPRTFAIMAQDAQRDGALRLTERIQAALPSRMRTFEGAAAFTVSFGIATLPEFGQNLDVLLANAERALAASVDAGGSRATFSSANLSAGIGPNGAVDASDLTEPARLQQGRIEALAEAARSFDRHEIDGVIIRAHAGACSACLDLARDQYRPTEVPPLPVADCKSSAGCRCMYEPAPLDPYRRPPPVPEVDLETLQIPIRWREAARIGADQRADCKPEDLAAYLDAFPLVPIKVRVALEPTEVAYLTRPVVQAWEKGVRAGGIAASGVLLPLAGPLGTWVRQIPRPGALPAGMAQDRVEATFVLTSWRILLSRAGEVESYLLADVSGVEYLRDALVCRLLQREDRLVILVHDPLQVGLCVARAIRTISHWTH